MDVAIRPLMREDLRQVQQIEREAFSGSWPVTPFKRDMESRRATYLVAWEPHQDGVAPPADSGHKIENSNAPLATRLVGNLRSILGYSKTPALATDDIRGFVGVSFPGTQAHITVIAVSEAHRGRGIGELLLIGSIEMAVDRGAEFVGLEVRVSNHVAQALYKKYAFDKVRIYKGYYSDDREDAVVMNTPPINTPEYQAEFNQLRETYRQSHGEIRVCLV